MPRTLKAWLKTNLSAIVSPIMQMFHAVDADLDEMEAAIEDISAETYDAIAAKYLETAVITIQDVSGTTTINRVGSDAHVVTTITSGALQDIITMTIIPVKGVFQYTKTTTITPGASYDTVDISYTRSYKSVVTLSLSKDTSSIAPAGTDTVTVTTNGELITLACDDTDVATATHSEGTITITGVATGTCTITVTSSKADYTSAVATIDVTVS